MKYEKCIVENEEGGSRSERKMQKLKIMYLMKILMEETDEDHYLTRQQIVDKLNAYGVTAERKSVYSDIQHLNDFGLEVHGFQKDKTFYYHLINRDFELSELKLLVDAVQASKFITQKESENLIKKLEKYVSKYQAEQMHRQVYVNGRVKSRNEKNLYSVDYIHEAIDSNKKIIFQYFHYDVDRNEVLAHNGKLYKVSPWAMCWDDEKYYLVGYDESDMENKIKHFRVDKMIKTEILDEKRIGKDAFRKMDMARYTDRLFGMFDGELRHVELLCDNSMANVIYDRFGLDTSVVKVDDTHFKALVNVAVSRIFFGWIMALEKVKIIGPDDVVANMKEHLRQQFEQYFNEL